MNYFLSKPLDQWKQVGYLTLSTSLLASLFTGLPSSLPAQASILPTNSTNSVSSTPSVSSIDLVNSGVLMAATTVSVSLQGITNSANVSGKIYVSAQVSTTPSSVLFYVDGKLITTEKIAPYTLGGDAKGVPYGYDTSVLANGTHTLMAVAVVNGVSYNSPMITFYKGVVGRDKFLWPFAADSIWNMPIGSNAAYKPANIGPAGRLSIDQEYFYQLKASDPMRPVYRPGSWQVRCSGTNATGTSLPIPDDLIVPDATSSSTPNNASAFLLPDGKSLVQLNPLARCVAGGPVYGHVSPTQDIYGPGIRGGHGGSGLSSIGGSIRLGELIDNQPIRHALKVVIWAKKYLSYTGTTPGYRWPAIRADSYASPSTYGGTNPSLVQGSLLAIPPTVTEASLNLQTPVARKLFQALQNYGAYVVDDAAWDAHYFAVEKGVFEEFQATYGYQFGKVTSGPVYDDVMKLFQVLHVVDNNSATSIGGGGAPRAPLAPQFLN